MAGCDCCRVRLMNLWFVDKVMTNKKHCIIIEEGTVVIGEY